MSAIRSACAPRTVRIALEIGADVGIAGHRNAGHLFVDIGQCQDFPDGVFRCALRQRRNSGLNFLDLIQPGLECGLMQQLPVHHEFHVGFGDGFQRTGALETHLDTEIDRQDGLTVDLHRNLISGVRIIGCC